MRPCVARTPWSACWRHLRIPTKARATVRAADEGVRATRPNAHANTIRGMSLPLWLKVLNAEVIACTRCPRLVVYREQIAREKRRAYRDHDYWGKPVPSFGDPEARVLILGLAPGAHGSNRTGRMFTGDRSGDILYKVLYKTGFASQPVSSSRDDGLELRGAYITAACHCAPPGNKPLPA